MTRYWTRGTVLLLLGGLAWAPAPGCTETEQALPVEVALSPNPQRPVNPLLLGNNVQWSDAGDHLLDADGQLDSGRVAAVRPLGVTVLRYPGGSRADRYHWRDGVGPPDARGPRPTADDPEGEPVRFGTVEFLRLCKALGAAPLITVNTATGTPDEAAAWVGFVGTAAGSEAGLPRAAYWEVGNEPYLRGEGAPEGTGTAEEFAARADAFISAMRTADPSIRIGIPLRSDTIGGRSATTLPGFNETLLSRVREPYDFVALHDAYLPYLGRESYPRADRYLAAMAASAVVAADLDATAAQVRGHLGRPVPLALTEYNAFFSHGGPEDWELASLAGALYVADLIRVLTERDDILMANFWSLSGNWHFGAMDGKGHPRPAYHVLAEVARTLRGHFWDVAVDAPAFAAPAVGFVPATDGNPWVTGWAASDGSDVHLFLINKHPDRPAAVTVRPPEGGSAVIRDVRVLWAPDAFARRVAGWSPRPVPADAVLNLPPHSVASVEVCIGMPGGDSNCLEAAAS